MMGVALRAYASDVDRFCSKRGSGGQQVCVVPISVLILEGERFDGKIVELTGYFAYGNVSVLFAGKDDFLTSNVVNGVAVNFPIEKKQGRKAFFA